MANNSYWLDLVVILVYFHAFFFFLFQVFVETLDKCFENVCELDLIFHMDKVSRDIWALGQFSILFLKL